MANIFLFIIYFVYFCKCTLPAIFGFWIFELEKSSGQGLINFRCTMAAGNLQDAPA